MLKPFTLSTFQSTKLKRIPLIFFEFPKLSPFPLKVKSKAHAEGLHILITEKITKQKKCLFIVPLFV